MKIGLIIPDRGDRPCFMQNCNRLLFNQTVQPDEIYRVNEAPKSDAIDITYRYRKGYEWFRGRGFDLLFFIESDDYYSPTYIETALAAWNDAGQPDLFGQRSTEYYHIGIRKHFTFHHEQRSSAMSTLIKPDLDLTWPADSEPYTDVWLFSKMPYKLWQPDPLISVGIKGHEEGLAGGKCHTTDLSMYDIHGKPDLDMSWLKELVDPASFAFYFTFFSEGTTSRTRTS